MDCRSYHGSLSRLRAEELLLSSGKSGSYLIRDSESIRNAYTLCIFCEGKILQYRIRTDDKGLLYIESNTENVCKHLKFPDLNQLVIQYVKAGDSNGLQCALKYPIEPTSVLDSDKESDDEEDLQNGAPPPPRRPSYENEPTSSSKYFKQRFSKLDVSEFDGAFVNALKDYAERDIMQDIDATSSSELTYLHKLLSNQAEKLSIELERYFAKIDVCRRLFGELHSSPLAKKKTVTERNAKVDINELSDKLCQVKVAVGNLKRKAIQRFEYLQNNENEENTATSSIELDNKQSSSEEIKTNRVIPCSTFEAKVLKHGIQSIKVKLTVDIQAGKLFIIKPSKEVFDSTNTFTHDKILQIIKSTTNNCKIDMKLEGRKKETYAFDKVHDRENFCQMVQQLKNAHCVSEEKDHLSIFIGTWNMGDEPPPYNLSRWLKSQGLGKTRPYQLSFIAHDLYVIGTQESSLTEKEWISRLKKSLTGAEHGLMSNLHVVQAVSLWGLRLLVLVKGELKNKISHVSQSTVKTGIANTLGNKGAVAVSFHFNGSSFCFVNSHLTSGHERNSRRNQNFRDILKGLSLGSKKHDMFDITNQFQYVFWLGDLNYRLDGMENRVPEVLNHIKGQKFPLLLLRDQLVMSQEKKESFFEFNEEDITFPPTYRYGKGNDDYIWQKPKKTYIRINCPSWCDRVLWHAWPESYVNNTAYGCVDDIRSSDHRPVFSTFEVGVRTQFTMMQGAHAPSGQVRIVFDEIHAKLKTSSRDSFKLEFHSSCLAESKKSQFNKKYDSSEMGYCCPAWETLDIQEMIPLFDDKDYLEDQHMLITVKSCNGEEPYGECVIALKPHLKLNPAKFECSLTHFGEVTGVLWGRMQIKFPQLLSPVAAKRSRKSYELIYMDFQIPDLDKMPLRSTSSNPLPTQKTKTINNNTTRSNRQLVPLIKKIDSAYEHPASVAEIPQYVNTESSSVYDYPQSDHDLLSSKEIAPFIEKKSVSSMYSQVSKPQTSPRKNSSSQPCVEASSSVDLPSAIERKPDKPLFLSLRQVSQPADTAPEDKPHYADVTVPASAPVETGNRKNCNQVYARLANPMSVQDWLHGLDLPQYTWTFKDNGWDNVQFLRGISEDDLMNMNIKSPSHRRRILESLDELQ